MIRKYLVIVAVSVLTAVSCKQKVQTKTPPVAVRQTSHIVKKPACCTNIPPRFSFKKTDAEKLTPSKPGAEKQ
jgi:hypothetical protein